MLCIEENELKNWVQKAILSTPKNASTVGRIAQMIAGSEKKINPEITSHPIVAQNKCAWYVLRVTYQREMQAHLKLMDMGIESYVPTQRKKIVRGGRVCYRTVSALHNYLFVRATLEEIRQIKELYIPYLRYMMGHDENGNRCPQCVPEEQMRHFIAITGNEQEMVKYLDPETIDLAKGDRVRIVAGPFEGVEGVFMKVSAKNEKRVVVKIEGVTAVATAAIPAALVERI